MFDEYGNEIPAGEPTPAEIAEGLRMIRSAWSERERYLRAGLRVPHRLAIITDHDRGIVEPTPIPFARMAELN